MAKKKYSDEFKKTHWEKNIHENLLKETNTKVGAEFNPMPSSRRMTTYNKTNECDT